MDFNDYQHKAQATDQRPQGEESLVIPLLGLAGEVGTLLSEHKKRMRDGEGHAEYEAMVAEELGDLLWYIANVASKFNLSLSDIAEANLLKVGERWNPNKRTHPELFDIGYPPDEQLPREFEVEFRHQIIDGVRMLVVERAGKRVGDPLSDAAQIDDGYRYHDAIHLAFATYLGWSPVTRRNFRRKRRGNSLIDETEDGGRAIVTEEAVVAHAYAYARRHGMLRGIAAVDYETLRTIKELTSVFEVSVRSTAEWQRAIIEGFRVFNLLRQHGGGTVRGNLLSRELKFLPPFGGE